MSSSVERSKSTFGEDRVLVASRFTLNCPDCMRVAVFQQLVFITSVAEISSLGLYITGARAPEKWIYDADLKLNNFEWTSVKSVFLFARSIDC